MTDAKEALLQYLNQQFPATKGHLPLLGLIRDVERQGRRAGFQEATDIAKRENE